MKKTPLIIVLVGIGILLVAGAVMYIGKSYQNNPPTPSASTSSNSNAPIAATITYDGNGFSPSNVTVKSGDSVTIKNTSSSQLELESDPHPVHTDDTDLNVGDVAAGQSKTFIVVKKGAFGYHNHLNPSQTGNITIN